MKNQFIFGVNAVSARLKLGKDGIEKMLIRKGELSTRLNDLLLLGQEVGCGIERVGDDALGAMTDIAHQGVGLEMLEPKTKNENYLFDMLDDLDGNILLLVLDGVTDPRNLGACLRSAATLGVNAVIVPKDNSAALNEAAMKTASGGASYVPLIEVVNLARCLEKLKKADVWLVGTLLETDQDISSMDLKGNVAIVMGSEEKGLRQKTIKTCDFLAKIPMKNENFGFNVSVATGICLYEAQRQRLSS